VAGPLQGVKNRIAEFVRTVVSDKNVAPSHAWRHRFKTTGIEAGIEHRILDAIQGHSPRSVAEGYGDVTIRRKQRPLRSCLAIRSRSKLLRRWRVLRCPL